MAKRAPQGDCCCADFGCLDRQEGKPDGSSAVRHPGPASGECVQQGWVDLFRMADPAHARRGGHCPIVLGASHDEPRGHPRDRSTAPAVVALQGHLCGTVSGPETGSCLGAWTVFSQRAPTLNALTWGVRNDPHWRPIDRSDGLRPNPADEIAATAYLTTRRRAEWWLQRARPHRRSSALLCHDECQPHWARPRVPCSAGSRSMWAGSVQSPMREGLHRDQHPARVVGRAGGICRCLLRGGVRRFGASPGWRRGGRCGSTRCRIRCLLGDFGSVGLG